MLSIQEKWENFRKKRDADVFDLMQDFGIIDEWSGQQEYDEEKVNDIIKRIPNPNYRSILRKLVDREVLGKGVPAIVDPDVLDYTPQELAELIKERYTFKTPRDIKEIHIFKEGVYHTNGSTFIRQEVRDLLKENCKRNLVEEVIAGIKETTYIDRENINTNGFLPLQNGLLDLKTLKLKPHTPDLFFTFKIPIEYKKGDKPKKFLKWLNNTLKDDSDNWKWKIDTIQEMFGYCFLMDVRYQKAFLLYGERRAGKSTLLRILTKLLDKQNTTSMTLQQITTDRFAIAYLYDKPANISADLTATALRDTGTFMTLTGNDQMSSAKKGGHLFTFDPITKLIFSCNEIPRTPNKNLAFYRRWIPIHFPNSLPENEIDESIENEIKNEEMSGILNWGLKGLVRLLKNGKFSCLFDEYEIKDMYEKFSDSTSSFILTQIIEDDVASVLKRDVYKAYEKYCHKDSLRVENPISFGRLFKNVTGCGVTTINKIPAYAGIKLKNKNGEQKKVFGEGSR